MTIVLWATCRDCDKARHSVAHNITTAAILRAVGAPAGLTRYNHSVPRSIETPGFVPIADAKQDTCSKVRSLSIYSS